MRTIFVVMVLAACGKVNETSDAARDSAPGPLVAPGVTITAHPFAGGPVTCKVAMQSTGGTAPITYSVSWTLDAVAFPGSMKTTFVGDTVPGTATHTGHVFACTVTATDAVGNKAVAEPLGITVDGRFAFTIAQSGTLFKIDLDTNSLRTVGAVGTPYSFGDLAWDSSAQTLYMIDGEETDKSLFTLNTSTGAATLVGAHGFANVFALVYDAASDKLFGSAFAPAPSFFSLNKTTGASMGIGGAASSAIEGLAFDTKRNMLVGVIGGPGNLVSVDPTTGTSTPLATATMLVNDCGLIYDPIVDKLFAIDTTGKLFQYDPANSYAQTLVTTFTTNGFSGIALALPPAM